MMRHGLVLRYVDDNNNLWVVAESTGLVTVTKRIASTNTVLASATGSPYTATSVPYHTLRARVSAAGRFAVWQVPQGTETFGAPLIAGSDSALATGGTLASGKSGFMDFNDSVSAFERDYDNFWAASTAQDAAIFPSQSLEIRHNLARREDVGGTLWVEPSSYEGDYLRVPPAGAEARTLRVIVKMSRNAPGEGPDGGIDDISARLFVTPRYLT